MKLTFNVIVCYAVVLASVWFGASIPAFAQRWGGSCFSGSCFRGSGCSYQTYSRPTGGNCRWTLGSSGESAFGAGCARSYAYTYAPTCANRSGGSFVASDCNSALRQGRVSNCNGGNCGTYRYSYQSAFSYCSSDCAGGSCDGGVCAIRDSSRELDAVEACEPVKACEQVKACACDACECSPCQCVETTETKETTEPLPACGSVRTTSTSSGCASGSCPLRSATRTVAQTASNVVARTAATGYLAAVNAARAVQGLPALALDGALQAGAQRQANAMARYGALFHSGGVAENCAESSSAQGAVNMWLGSPGHYANMMNPRYTRAGLAAGRDARGHVFWCLQLR